MAYAQEMKNLVANIKTSHRDRIKYVNDVKKDTKDLMTQIQRELKDIKGDTADLLAQYDKELKELAAELKDFLRKSEAARAADFKAMMPDITSRVKEIRKAVAATLGEYKVERKEAAGHWAALKKVKRMEAPVTVKAVVKTKKKK